MHHGLPIVTILAISSTVWYVATTVAAVVSATVVKNINEMIAVVAAFTASWSTIEVTLFNGNAQLHIRQSKPRVGKPSEFPCGVSSNLHDLQPEFHHAIKCYVFNSTDA